MEPQFSQTSIRRWRGRIRKQHLLSWVLFFLDFLKFINVCYISIACIVKFFLFFLSVWKLRGSSKCCFACVTTVKDLDFWVYLSIFCLGTCFLCKPFPPLTSHPKPPLPPQGGLWPNLPAATDKHTLTLEPSRPSRGCTLWHPLSLSVSALWPLSQIQWEAARSKIAADDKNSRRRAARL